MSIERVQLSDRIEYRLNGELHREDGPAREFANGDEIWYLNGKLHRVDGPAIEWANGTKEWCLNGKYHRVDGPAVIYADGSKYWYLFGREKDHGEHKDIIYNRFRSVYQFAYHFPGAVDADIKNRLMRFAGFH